MKTILIREDLEQAAELLRNGGLVGVPTETVYGLAGNGLDEAAVHRIYEVKGRPELKPLALMVPDADGMERYCVAVPQAAKALAELIPDDKLSADYIMPEALDPRVGPAVAKAVAQAARDSGVARI